ncbi:MAG: ABC transporter ATP-binding protein [Eubacterium sp.]|nr:ABC transporter ATP-binding protein [Eubacterium sp.]
MKIEINNLTKRYGTKLAVNNFSVTLNSGVYALLGPNGSGKTTLMRMLCDVLRPTGGSIIADGTNISVLGEQYRDRLGYLPQNFGYYPNFSGMDFMLYLAALKGLPKLKAQERCEELLKLVGLYDVRKKKIKTYSGGMRQRIGIAQALINDPDLLVLDEPTVGLDPKERTKFRNIISDISENKTVLLSTHIVSDVEYIAGEVLIMKNGRLELRDYADNICRSIEGMVWDCTVSPKEADAMSEKYVVSNIRHVDGMAKMRIVSETKPCDDAEPTEPNLEDLYLYYFKENSEDEIAEI